jgi:tetratricopeptide (TPR) repeat protein
MRKFLLPFMVLLIPILLQADPVIDHLTFAEDAIGAGDYETALDHYTAALNENGDASVHYKLARLICILRRKELVCEYDAYVDYALKELTYALALDPTLKQEMAEDTALFPLYGTVLFNIWRGGSIETDSAISAILPRICWQTIPEGIGVTEGFMNFECDSTVHVHWGACYDYVEYDDASGEAMPLSRGKQEGTYFVREGRIIIEWHTSYEYDLEGELPRQSVYRIELDGVYGILKALSPNQINLYDIPDECSI